jgi:phospholipase C
MRVGGLARSWLAGSSLAALLGACSSHGSQPAKPVVTEEQAAAKRLACQFTTGALPADTLASDAPTGSKIPIDHIVLVMQENRSFDHYFSKLSHDGIDVAAPDATNPDAMGNPVPRQHLAQYCFDNPSHSWDNVHKQLDNNKLDGFVTDNDPNGSRAMGYYDETDLPFYYALARTFSISDRHFCSLPGPTWPNRMFYFAGTSYGLTTNTAPPDTDPDGNPYPNLFTRMEDAHVTWNVYAQKIATPVIFASTFAETGSHYVGQDAFWTDAASGKLPSVSIFEAKFSDGADGNDEHPPSDPQIGQNLIAKVVKTLMDSPTWSSTALFITYDEHGGLYDHVVPPAACKPDNLAPHSYAANGTIQMDEGDFAQYGFRVPLIVVSPYARRGHVSHHVTDHTSILRFVEARFNLPAMTGRDANAEPPFDMFDFTNPNLDKPTLPEAVIEPTEQARCLKAYPPGRSGLP